ncbi:hypothetical protein UQW22_18470 [Isoptericola halotolerans]|uniref:hypothetical protein n=1 Tax=Isoptericola halotolerans TaxID=300560 RepID=UPI00388D6065
MTSLQGAERRHVREVPPAALVLGAEERQVEFPASLGAWQTDALGFLLDSVPDDLVVTGGGVLFGVLMLWVATRALRRAAHRTLTLPGRDSAGTWGALFVIMVAVSFTAVVAPGSRGVVWLGYSMVIILVLGYVAWTALHLRAHVSRVRALRALGVTVERRWYRPWLTVAAAAAPWLVDLGGVLVSRIPDSTPVGVVLTVMAFSALVAPVLLWVPLLVVQLIAFSNYFGRVRTRWEQILRTHPVERATEPLREHTV